MTKSKEGERRWNVWISYKDGTQDFRPSLNLYEVINICQSYGWSVDELEDAVTLSMGGEVFAAGVKFKRIR